MGNKKILIIFPDPWISVAPSIINFTRMLEKYGISSVILYYHGSGEFYNNNLPLKLYSVKLPKILEKIFSKAKILSYIKIFLMLFSAYNILKKEDINKVVGVDDVGFFTSLFLPRIRRIYYSLEINRGLLNKIIFTFIKPFVIIQNKQRLSYLAGNYDLNKVAFIQNSPILENEYCSYYEGSKTGLIYFGNLLKSHGVEECISLLRLMDEKLTIKFFKTKTSEKYLEELKRKYSDLIKSGRLIFQDFYLEQDKVVDYLKNFKVGFVFYDQKLIRKNYNYATSPSGKIFNYLAAGVPVIASKLTSFDFVEEFKCGILIEDLDVNTIYQSVQKIYSNYNEYSNNALRAIKFLAYNHMFEKDKEKIFYHLNLD